MSNLSWIFWLVSADTHPNEEADFVHVVTQGIGREDAKRNARQYLGGSIDSYIVTPLTSPGERVYLNVQVKN